MHKTMSVLFLVTLVGGCSSTGSTLDPAELTEYKRSVSTTPLWEKDSSLIRSTKAEIFTPYVEDKSIFVSGAKGKVKCFDRLTGKLIWMTDLDVLLISGVSGDGQRVYTTGLEGQLYALNKVTGDVVWEAKFNSEALAPPAASDGMLVLRNNNGDLIGLSADTGHELWRRKFNVPALTIYGYSMPLIVPGGVLLGLDDGSLVALTLTEGKLIWKTQLSQPQGRSEIERMIDADGAIVVDNAYIYAVNYQGKLVQLEPEKGQVVWSRKLSSISGVSVDDKAVYATEPDGYIWALDKRTGASYWQQKDLEGRGVTRPVSFKDYLVVGDALGYVHILSKVDGSTVGRVRIDEKPIRATPVVFDGMIYVLSSNGLVSALNIEKILADKP